MRSQLTVRDVGYTYRSAIQDVEALRNVDLQLRAGTSTAIVGRSGSGKSTLVSLLALLRRPSSGSIIIGERDTASMSDAELARTRGDDVGVVFQSFHLDSSATALENVMLPYYFQGRISRAEADRRARDRLDLMDIGELTRRRPSEMSGGQRQRVAIARALLMNPLILLADEPTGNLDEETAFAIVERIFTLAADIGTSIAVVTHDSDIADMADRTVHIHAGRLSDEAPT